MLGTDPPSDAVPALFPNNEPGHRHRALHSHSQQELSRLAGSADARHRRRLSPSKPSPTKRPRRARAKPKRRHAPRTSRVPPQQRDIGLLDDPIEVDDSQPTMSVAELHNTPDVVADTMLDRDTNCSDTLVTQQSEPSCSDTIVYEPQGAAASSSGSDCMPLTYLSEPHSAQALYSDDDLAPLSLLVNDMQPTLPGTSSGGASRQASLAPQFCLLWLFIWLANPVMWTGLVTAVSPMPIVRCTQTQWRRQRRALALMCRLHTFLVSHSCPRTRRPLHPLRGVRVGEASHPGPPVGRLIAQTQQTLLDAFSQSSSHRLREASEDPAETAILRNAAYPSTATEQQVLASTFEVQLLHQTSSVTFSVHARPGHRWQWCLMSQPMLLSQFARTPAIALEQFLAKHGAALYSHTFSLTGVGRVAHQAWAHSTARVPVEVPLAEQDNGDMQDTSPQASPFSRPEPAEEQALLDWTQLETIASMDLATQRHIPRQLHAAIQSATLQLLHSSSLERDNHARGLPSAAHLLFLWPQPRSDQEGPMASRASLRHCGEATSTPPAHRATAGCKRGIITATSEAHAQIRYQRTRAHWHED
eukprot:3174463-Amphidinium_carterae.1